MDIERQISNLALQLVKQRPTAEYRTFCEGFPTLLRTAGLAQTVAFLRAKGGSPHGDLYAHLNEHFAKLNLLADKQGLLDLVVDSRTETSQYRLYSQIALRVAYWHKRLAQALVEKSK